MNKEEEPLLGKGCSYCFQLNSTRDVDAGGYSFFLTSRKDEKEAYTRGGIVLLEELTPGGYSISRMSGTRLFIFPRVVLPQSQPALFRSARKRYPLMFRGKKLCWRPYTLYTPSDVCVRYVGLGIRKAQNPT
jgi:hypothetical protein